MLLKYNLKNNLPYVKVCKIYKSNNMETRVKLNINRPTSISVRRTNPRTCPLLLHNYKAVSTVFKFLIF